MQFTKLALAAFSLGSAIAAPVVGDLPALTNALSAVGNVRTIVETQVATITTLTKSTPAGDVVTKVEASLQTVGQQVSGLVNPLSALNNIADPTALTTSQLASVPQLVSDCQAIIAGVQTIGKTVVSGVGQDALNQVQPELQWVLSLAGPVAKPLISFTTTAVPATSAVYKQVNSGVANIQGVVNTLVVAPVNGVAGGLLGGLLN